jgi:hypothetical protein
LAPSSRSRYVYFVRLFFCEGPRRYRLARRRSRHGARLAASYLLAGDVETARRYLDEAEKLLEQGSPSS